MEPAIKTEDGDQEKWKYWHERWPSSRRTRALGLNLRYDQMEAETEPAASATAAPGTEGAHFEGKPKLRARS